MVASGTPEFVRALLPTVVNITVKKAQAPEPVTGDAATVSANVPNAAAPDIKTYVGSGFVIDPEGLLVTNYHVVEDAFEIAIMFSDGSILPGNIESASRIVDLALVRVHPAHPLAAAHWGDSNKLVVGDQVFVAGNPFGLGLSVSSGIVSALNRNIQNSPYDDMIQTDAAINHGNSGGPLFDMQGNVIGVNSDIISPTPGWSGLGFAMPSNFARFVVDRLRTYGWDRPAWIGVKVQQVTPTIAEAMGMAQPQGSIVAWVWPGSPAHKTELAIGDVILRYDNKAPTDVRALLREIAATGAGTTVPIVVWRNGTERTVLVTPEVFPRERWEKQDAPLPTEEPHIVIPPDLGLSLAMVSDAAKKSIGLKNGLTAVLVDGVQPDSDAAHRGLANGDLILRVQDKPVATPADVWAGIDAARAAKRDHVLMLILPKERRTPGPNWVTLQINDAAG
jgi:serine protease Do